MTQTGVPDEDYWKYQKQGTRDDYERKSRLTQERFAEAPTNLEMLHYIHAKRAEREARMQADGCCCEEGPWDDGRCRHAMGICPLIAEAKRILGEK